MNRLKNLINRPKAPIKVPTQGMMIDPIKDPIKYSIRRTILFSLGIVVLMLGFTFALVPLYSVFCKVTGINGKVDLSTTGRYAVNTGEITNRLITVEFDTNLHPDMPFEFSPEHAVLQVTPGALNHTSYFIKNKTDKTVIVQAVPSISPGIVAKHLKKLECFCFTQQTLKPKEAAQLPLRFWLEPEFPDSVHRLTLSYTLFDVSKKLTQAKETE